jgi:hypothetical protein
MTDESGRDGNHTRPGLFQSGGEAVVTFLIWLLIFVLLSPLVGLYGHVVFKLLKLGWDLL